MTHLRLVENDLDRAEYERDVYRQIAEASRRCGLVDVIAERQSLPLHLLSEEAQAVVTGDAPPSVPFRKAKAQPTLPWSKRLALWLQPKAIAFARWWTSF